MTHAVPGSGPFPLVALVDVQLEELLDLPASLVLVGVGAREVDLGLVPHVVGHRGEGGDDREGGVELVKERREALDLAHVGVPVPPFQLGKLEEML